MNPSVFQVNKNYSLKANYKIIVLSFLCVLLLVLLASNGISKEKLFLIFGILLILNISLNFEASIYFLLFSIFFSFYINYFHASIIASVILIFSIFFTKYELKLKDFKNIFTIPLLVYLIFIIPSFFNTINPLLSLYEGLNFFAFLIILYFVSVGIDDFKKIDRIIYLFIFFVLLNSIYVINLAILYQKRVFGFPGVFYGDFAGLSSIITIILFLFEKNSFKKYIYGTITTLIILSLIFTQTRNSWLSFASTLILLIIYLIFSNKTDKKFKYKIIFYFSIILVAIVILFFVSLTMDKSLSSRATTITTSKINTQSLQSLGNNSLLTRFFIWHTAIMAFLEHPFIGIGFNSFYFSSQLYYKIPTFIFELFVKRSHPHITYLAVLVETGIVGLIGFLYFISTIIKQIFKSLNINQNYIQFRRSLILNWSFVYIIISMFMTDAWLWGQQIVLFGILLGLSVSNFKLLFNILTK